MLVLGVIGVACVPMCAPEALILVEDLEGNPVNPFAGPGEPLRVFLFLREDCPISNRYAPEIARLHDEFGDGARFALVYPDPNATAETIGRHREAYALSIPAWRDPEHALVAHSGVTITPEVAVYRGTDRIYRGRIDDRWVAFGKERSAPQVRDLHDVLISMRAGDTFPPYETEAVGCHIGDLAP